MFTHIISDTHFGHARIIGLAERPFSSVEEMNETLIENWNRAVPEDGVVLHLGDFAHDNVPVEEMASIRARLNGRIVMTLGNHDRLDRVLAARIAPPEDVLFWWRQGDAVFSHLPLDPYLLFRARVSVHGHTHGQKSDLDPVSYAGAVSVNCELTGYAPLSWADLEARMEGARARLAQSWAARAGY